MADVLTIDDLIADKKHSTFFAEVVTGKSGGTSGGGDISTATNAVTGQVQKTIPAITQTAESEHNAQIAAHELEHDNQIAAHELEFNGRLAGMAFTRVGTFTNGATLTDMRQTLLWDLSQGGDGHEYGWSGAFPKVVAAGSTPAASGGVGAGAWVDRSDDSLRDEIRETVFQNMKRQAAEAGLNLADGSFEEGAVISGWPDVVWSQALGIYLQWHLDEAKTVPAGSTPATTGGVGAGAWVDRSDVTLRNDVVLRNELSSNSGSEMIGTSSGTTVQEFIQSISPRDGEVFASAVVSKSGRNAESDYAQVERMKKSISALDNSGAVIILGDSISNAQGSSEYTESFVYKFCRSIFNRMDGVNSADKGYGFETVMNMATAVKAPGISHTGSIITSSGAMQSRLQLDSGQSLTVTGREVKSVDVFYDASLTTGDMVFTFNGSTYATKSPSGTGTQTTFPTNPFTSGSSIHPDDTIMITASGGTVVITGLITLRESHNSPYVYVAARSGWGFDEFADTTRADEITAQVAAFRASAQKTLFVFLGTNNMYNAALQKTPADYIAALESMLAVYSSRLSNLSVVLSVPLKANESVFPLMSGYEYTDYVNSIIEFADDNGHFVIRFDDIGADETFYSDGVHPVDAGHSAMCAQVCKQIGIPYNPSEFCNSIVNEPYREQNIVYSGAWRNFLGLAKTQVKAHKIGRIVHLSGLADSNGTTTLEIGRLPVGVRPRTNDVYLCCITSAGPARIKIGADGYVTVLSAPTDTNSFVSFCGLSYVVKPI